MKRWLPLLAALLALPVFAKRARIEYQAVQLDTPAPDGRVAAVGDGFVVLDSKSSSTLELYDRKGTFQRHFFETKSKIDAWWVPPGGESVVWVSAGKVRICKTGTEAGVGSVTATPTSVAFAANGGGCAFIDKKALYVWMANEPAALMTGLPELEVLAGPAWCDDGKAILVLTRSNENDGALVVQKMDPAKKDSVWTEVCREPLDPAPLLAAAPTGSRFALATGGRVILCDLRNPNPDPMFSDKATPTEMTWTADGSAILLTLSGTRAVRVETRRSGSVQQYWSDEISNLKGYTLSSQSHSTAGTFLVTNPLKDGPSFRVARIDRD